MTTPSLKRKADTGGTLGNALRRLKPLDWPKSEREYLGDLVVPDTERRYAIVSTITDNFVGLGAVFLLSLHEVLAIRDEVDVILLQSPDVAPLSAENRALLASTCPGLKFIDIDTSSFLTKENMTRYDKQGNPRSLKRDKYELPSKKAAYVKLNVLRLTQYDKVVLIDSDMMVVNDFSEIFSAPHDLAAVPSGKPDPSYEGDYSPRGVRRGGFNTGFVLLNAALRGRRPFNAALDFLEMKRDRRLRDQSILNRIFERTEKLYLPHSYNYKLRVMDPDILLDPSPLETAKIIHFVATSKWLLKDPAYAGQPIYERFHALQARTGVPFILEP